MPEIDKHEKKIYSCEKNKVKGPKKWFGRFLFLFHSSRWFLMVSPKDTFTFLPLLDKLINTYNKDWMLP
jgi:hypothetical protein